MQEKNTFLFSKLPRDVIYYLLLFDEHFIMRNGEIVSIIPKTDYRYRLLEWTTLHKDHVETYSNVNWYHYYFRNLYHYPGRQLYNSDYLQVVIQEQEDNVQYKIWIGKQKPKTFLTQKPQIYFLENAEEYHWVYTEYEYVRR